MISEEGISFINLDNMKIMANLTESGIRGRDGEKSKDVISFSFHSEES